MKTIVIEKPAGFSLDAASEFYVGFTPGSGMAAAATDQLTLAFRLDHSFAPVAVSLREQHGALVAELSSGADEQAVRWQLGRMLGLEADAEAWWALGERVPLVGALQREFPGFLTAAKSSPYDAAVWSLIAPRLSMQVAARIKLDLARTHGTAVALNGKVHHVFPGPEVLLALDHAPGLPRRSMVCPPRSRACCTALRTRRGTGCRAPLHLSVRPRRFGPFACGSPCCSHVISRAPTTGTRPSSRSRERAPAERSPSRRRVARVRWHSDGRESRLDWP